MIVEDDCHSKLAFKAPFTGSAQFWHQDYSYWRDGHPRDRLPG
jgi:hypothetical protein